MSPDPLTEDALVVSVEVRPHLLSPGFATEQRDVMAPLVGTWVTVIHRGDDEEVYGWPVLVEAPSGQRAWAQPHWLVEVDDEVPI